MMGKVSPLAPKQVLNDLPPIDGVRFAVAETRIRYEGRPDLLLAVFDDEATVAGVLTQSRCPSAAVDWCREQLVHGTARALVANAGNANAFTGQKGRDAVNLTSKLAAEAVKCQPQNIFIASTGVIGEPLDARKFHGFFDNMMAEASTNCWIDAAKTIMTTDTYPKLATRHAKISGHIVTINGIAKGSGMIAPNMATLLSFIFTDAPIDAQPLQAMLSRSVNKSFNCITVDSDTSTSDTVLCFSTRKAKKRGVPQIHEDGDPQLTEFEMALDDLLHDLALQVVCDGEGASKLIEVVVKGANDNKSAHRIALSIANSPLVKTAIAGEDANWGRVVMAVGKAGEMADRDRLEIWFGSHRVAHNGQRDTKYNEKDIATYMKGQKIEITVDLNIGQGKNKIWTCDMTHEYIDINAHYRS